MTNRTRLDWRVPSDEWESFREYVSEKHGDTDLYLQLEISEAMRDYIGYGSRGAVEEYVDRLAIASRTTAAPESSQTDLKSGETTRVTVRVSPNLKRAFRDSVDANSSYGVELARALAERKDGGLYGRLESKLGRIIDDGDAVSQLESGPSSDEEVSR